MSITTLQVRRDAFAETRVVDSELPELDEGQILVRIDKFALTANNVTYAITGDAIGYWRYYPADSPWGVVPVWGFADVVQSRVAQIPVGERVWGFLPMASHAVMTPARLSPSGWLDGAPRRRPLAAAYNAYARTAGDPPELAAIEDERCILFPLYTLSYILCDYLVDNAYFGAREVLISSVSSKTALGFARLLRDSGAGRPEIVGLTSPGNVDFVRGVGVCDRVAIYGQISELDASRPAAFVDMAGQGDIVSAVHRQFGANLKASIAIGATHGEATGLANTRDPASPHKFFFAPEQIAKRDKEWGPGEAWRRSRAACFGLVRDLQGAMTVSREFGAEAATAAWLRLVAGRQPANTGIIASLSRAA